MLAQTAFAEGINLETTYPYSLDHKNIHKTVGSATNPLYINIESYDVPDPQDVEVEIILPEGLFCNDDADWQKIKTDQGLVIKRNWLLPANYGQNFDLLYLRASEELAEGKHDIVVKVSGKSWQKNNVITFVHELGAKSEEVIDQPTKQLDKSKFNWYIQSITLPVDNLGNKDDRMQDGTIYIKDTALESFRNEECFQVSGHFRLQPYGDGTRRLIWINEYTKNGYHRKATIDKVKDGDISLN